MSNDPLVIRYEKNVPAKDGRRAFLAGEEYAVADAAAAKQHHPDATIVRHLSGQPYQGSKPRAARSTASVSKRSRSKKSAAPVTPAPAAEETATA